MSILTTVSKASKGVQRMLSTHGDQEIVIIPFAQYRQLLERLEDLEDLHDHREAMKEYREGKGRAFQKFLMSYQGGG